jgi:hypothetical protein
MVAWFSRLTWSQRIGSVFGAVYVLVGAIGFFVTSGVGFAALRGKDLIVLELNPLHNIVHLGIGAALLYAALNSAAASRLMNRLIGGTYLAVAIVGAVIVEADMSLFGGLSETRSGLNILALNHPDNFLHLASSLVLIGSTFAGRRRSTDSVAAQASPAITSDATGEMPAVPDEAVVAEKSASLAAANAINPRLLLRAGDTVPKSGTYRCACGRFAVAIQRDREFPECPEPTGTDDDHFFKLQPKSPTTATARPLAKATTRTTGGGRKSAKTTSRR